MSRFGRRLRRLEERAAAHDPSRVSAIFLDVPDGKPAMVQTAGGVRVCENVDVVLAQTGALKVYKGIDPDWL